MLSAKQNIDLLGDRLKRAEAGMVEKTEIAKAAREEWEGAKQLKQARRHHLLGTHVAPCRRPPMSPHAAVHSRLPRRSPRLFAALASHARCARLTPHLPASLLLSPFLLSLALPPCLTEPRCLSW